MALDKKSILNLSHLLFVLLLLVLIAFFMSISAKNFSLGGQVQDLNDEWMVTYGDEVIQDAQLPLKLDIPPNTPYTISRRIITADEAGSVIRIRASMMSASVYIGEQLIYQEDIKDRSTWFYDPYPSVWYFVHIPIDTEGETLRITFSSPVQVFSGLVNAISFGTGESLLIDSLSDRFLDFIISFFLILVGIVLIFITPLTRKINADTRILLLGEFAIAVGFWLLSETRIMQIFTGNRFFIGSIGYLTVAFMPIPLLLYIRENVHEKFKGFYSAISAIFGLQLVSMLFLQVTGTVFYINSNSITLTLVIISALFIIWTLLYEVIKRSNKSALRLLIYFIIFLAFVTPEILLFFFQLFDFQSSFISIGVMVFYLLLAADSISYINTLMIKKNETLFYQKLAYQDSLTGGFNRAAFDRDLVSHMNQQETSEFRLILFDLNELKKINDTYGHVTGDKAIAAVYDALNASFNEFGTCYRISGDEFAVLFKDTQEEIYNHAIHVFKLELIKKSESFPQRLVVAAGSGVYQAFAEVTFDEFYHCVDQRMYEQKRAIKEQKK